MVSLLVKLAMKDYEVVIGHIDSIRHLESDVKIKFIVGEKGFFQC